MINNTFDIKPSRILNGLLIALHALTLVAAVMNTLPVIFKITLIIFIMLHFVWHWKKQVTQAVTTQFTYSETTGWGRIVNDEFLAIRILPSTILTPWLIVIHYYELPATALKTQICFKDALTANAFRLLTIQLKINGMPAQEQHTSD